VVGASVEAELTAPGGSDAAVGAAAAGAGDATEHADADLADADADVQPSAQAYPVDDAARGPGRAAAAPTPSDSDMAIAGAMLDTVSPICKQSCYRELLTVELAALTYLDGIVISHADRAEAKQRCALTFERFAYGRTYCPNAVEKLVARELGTSVRRPRVNRVGAQCGSDSEMASSCAEQRSETPPRNAREPDCHGSPQKHGGYSPIEFKRTMCAMRQSGPEPPSMRLIAPDRLGFRPRQFEYHPSVPECMVVGSMNGEVVVINHHNDRVIGSVQPGPPMSSILGLCWLQTDPTRLISGSDSGSIHLYDINRMQRGENPTVYTYDDFEHLTSVHINCTDSFFLVSGYSRDVALYDLKIGKRVSTFRNLHAEHINVLKFCHHSPSIFATSSFDKHVKLWDLRMNTEVIPVQLWRGWARSRCRCGSGDGAVAPPTAA
jgi:hypothetical protein